MNHRVLLMVAHTALSVACSPSAIQVQAQIANTSAIAANDALASIVRIYTAEGLAVIQVAPSRVQAEENLTQVRVRWHRVWGTEMDGTPCRGAGALAGAPCENGAWQALRASEELWATALERQIAGQPLDLAAAVQMGNSLHVAYCGLRAALPDGVRLPDPPSLLTCDVSSSGSSSSASSATPAH